MAHRRTRHCIAVAGDSQVEPGDARDRLAEGIGRGIIDAGHRLVTGGRGGVMEAACRGARSSPSWTDGAIIAVLPGSDPTAANPYVDVALATGLGDGRNQLVARSAAVIAIGGGAGTLSEIAFAWMYGRLIIGLRCGGWSELLADRRVDDRVRHPNVPGDRVYGARTAGEALELLAHHLPHYTR